VADWYRIKSIDGIGNAKAPKLHSAKKIKDIVVCDQQMKKREHNQYKCLIPFIFSQINTE
jgi:hypothetical protein